jgi:peroxiredoxin
MMFRSVSSFALFAALATAPGMLAQVPRPAPEVTVTDQAGQTIRLSSYRGKVVAVELMLTSCSHCQTTSRILSRLQKEFGPQGFQALGLAFNDDTGALSAQFAKEFNATYPIAPLSRDKAFEFAQLSPVLRHSVPILVFIDRKGMIRAQFKGDAPFFTNEEVNLRQMISSLLSEKAPTARVKPRS